LARISDQLAPANRMATEYYVTAGWRQGPSIHPMPESSKWPATARMNLLSMGPLCQQLAIRI